MHDMRLSRGSHILTNNDIWPFSSHPLIVHTIDAEGLVCNKLDRDVGFRTRTELHHLAFREPDKRSRSIDTLVGYQIPVKHAHAVGTRVRVAHVDDSLGIPHQTNFLPALLIFMEILGGGASSPISR